jgi:hypothetical protein
MEFVSLKKNYMKLKDQEHEAREKVEYYDGIASDLRAKLASKTGDMDREAKQKQASLRQLDSQTTVYAAQVKDLELQLQ